MATISTKTVSTVTSADERESFDFAWEGGHLSLSNLSYIGKQGPDPLVFRPGEVECLKAILCPAIEEVKPVIRTTLDRDEYDRPISVSEQDGRLRLQQDSDDIVIRLSRVEEVIKAIRSVAAFHKGI